MEKIAHLLGMLLCFAYDAMLLFDASLSLLQVCKSRRDAQMRAVTINGYGLCLHDVGP